MSPLAPLARSLALPAALFLLSPFPTASPTTDLVRPGFAFHSERAVGLFDAYATLPNGDRIVFDGTTVRREADDGTLIATLGSLPTPVFASFVLPDPTATFAIVGESSRGKLYRVDLAGGGMLLLADLDLNFDAKFQDPGHVLVSAAPCGFFCGTEIHRLDVVTGAMTLVATVTGPSGPLALSASGDLYYGVNPDWPVVTGSIVRWSAAQVASGAILDEASAVFLASGIVPPGSMAIEPVFGHLFVAQPVFAGTSLVTEYSAGGQPLGTVVESPEYLSGIEFRPTSGIGSFQAYQPDGVRLVYRATDYNANTSFARTIRTRRPRAITSGPGLTGPGLVTFTVHNAVPNASFLVMMGASSTYNPSESTYNFGYFLFHTGMPLGGIRRLGSVPTDASGTGSYSFFNPGGLEGMRVFQGLIKNTSGQFVGSSTEAFN